MKTHRYVKSCVMPTWAYFEGQLCSVITGYVTKSYNVEINLKIFASGSSINNNLFK